MFPENESKLEIVIYHKHRLIKNFEEQLENKIAEIKSEMDEEITDFITKKIDISPGLYIRTEL